MNVLRFLWNLLNTANAGPIAGPTSARPVVKPPAGAKPEKPDPKPKDDDEDDDDEEVDPAEVDAAKDEEEDPDAKDDEEDPDADPDDEDDDDEEDPDAALEDDDEEAKAELDEATESLRDAVEARLEGMTERDPDFGAGGIHLDLSKAKMSDAKKAALKKKLLADVEDPTPAETARADAIVEALESHTEETVLELMSQYHNTAISPVSKATFLAARERANGKRLNELKTKLGARYTPEVDAAMGELYEKLVRKYGFVRADTVPHERLFRMLPRKLRDATRTESGKGGKPKESKAERAARREREDALGAAGAPRGAIGRVSPKAGKDRTMTPEQKEQRKVAETIQSSPAKFF